MAENRWFVGLDLGQVQDFTALAVLERPAIPQEAKAEERRPVYALRHLQRFPLGTGYPVVVREVLALLDRPPLRGNVVLVVDQTGVGRPVVDLLAERLSDRRTFVPITITAGHAVNLGEDRSLHVPKKELIGVLQVLLQTRRLQVARSLPEAAILVRELETFRVKLSAAAHESFEAWRSGDHDDLVLAVALAAWLGEQAIGIRPDPSGPCASPPEACHEQQRPTAILHGTGPGRIRRLHRRGRAGTHPPGG